MTIKKGIEQVYYWQHDYTGNFNQLIITAIAKADPKNKERLRVAFPELVEAYDQWYHSLDPEKFFIDQLGENFK